MYLVTAALTTWHASAKLQVAGHGELEIGL